MLMKDRKKTEVERLKELESSELLDTPPESVFSDVVFLASKMCDAPIALISLVDKNRQWFKACIGISATETSREVAFCDYVVREKKMLVIEDTTLDPRFSGNPLVVNEPHIRFYTGIPLVSNGHVLGTLCIIDLQPRKLTNEHRHILEALSRQIMNQLELRKALKEFTKRKAG